MARSIHQTIKQVFFNKSKKEVDEMCNPDNLDIDVIELHKKGEIKKEILNERKVEKFYNNLQRDGELEGKLNDKC